MTFFGCLVANSLVQDEILRIDIGFQRFSSNAKTGGNKPSGPFTKNDSLTSIQCLNSRLKLRPVQVPGRSARPPIEW